MILHGIHRVYARLRTALRIADANSAIRYQRAFDQWKSSHDIDNKTGQGLCEKILENILNTSGNAMPCKVRSQDHRSCGCSGSYQDADVFRCIYEAPG